MQKTELPLVTFTSGQGLFVCATRMYLAALRRVPIRIP
jgi:pyruvate/2-oxoacid:ferredoxin oxidoreductase alpha subunit